MAKEMLSLPEEIVLYGYTIHKMPIGAYLKALKTLQQFPGELLSACFPDMAFKEVVNRLTLFDEKMLQRVASCLLEVAPEYFLTLISNLTGIPFEALNEDTAIGLDGLIHIIQAFIKVNKLGECLGGALEIKAMLAPLIRNTGSNG